MGDSRRFREMAKLVARHLDPRQSIVDVAGGKGGLRAELHRLGYRRVESWDPGSRRFAKGRPGFRRQRFHFEIPLVYDALVAMHPDTATDHAVLYATRHRIPALVCPCCSLPSATRYRGTGFESWVTHLERLAADSVVTMVWLPIRGRNLVLILKPVRRRKR